MTMLKISKSTVAKAAAKSKFVNTESEVPTHDEIVAEHKKTERAVVQHAERSLDSGKEFEVSSNQEFEVDTYIPEFPLDRVEMISQPRKKIDIDSCIALARSVTAKTENGNKLYEQPVTAWYCPEREKMVIKNGHRRTTGAMEDNWKTINLLVVSKQDELDRSFDQVIDNIHVETMDPFDVAFKFKEWCDLGYSYSKIADRLSLSKTTVSNYVTLSKLPKPIIDFGMLYLTDDVVAYVELNKLYKVDEKEALNLIEDCKKKNQFSRKIAKQALAKAKGKVASKGQDETRSEYKFEKATVNNLKSMIAQLERSGHKNSSVIAKSSDGKELSLSKIAIEESEAGPKVVMVLD